MLHEPAVPWAKINDFLLQIGTARSLSEFNQLVSSHVADLIPHDYPTLFLKRFDAIYDPTDPTGFVKGFDSRRKFLDAGILSGGEPGSVDDYNQFYRFKLPIPHGYFKYQPYTDFRALSNTAFVSDFIRPRNIGMILGGWYRSYTIVIPRTKPARPFSDGEQAILKVIAPHVENFYNALTRSAQRQAMDTRSDRSLVGLTKRELDIAKHVANGKTNNEIAQNLFISKETVKRHLYNIFAKLEVSNRTQLVRKILPGILLTTMSATDGH